MYLPLPRGARMPQNGFRVKRLERVPPEHRRATRRRWLPGHGEEIRGAGGGCGFWRIAMHSIMCSREGPECRNGDTSRWSVRLSPFSWLHFWQSNCRLRNCVWPPWDLGTIWSSVNSSEDIAIDPHRLHTNPCLEANKHSSRACVRICCDPGWVPIGRLNQR